MNFHYQIRRLLGRPTCLIHPAASLHARARIINIGGRSELISIGDSSIIEGELLVFPHGGRIAVGDWCYIGSGTRIWSDTSIYIGHRAMISHNVNIFDNLTHPINAAARHAQFRQIAKSGHPRAIDLGGKPVHIGDDVWISAGATVLRGVSIGRGSVIGAGAIVTRDVPAGVIVAGNPARIIRALNEYELTPSPSSVDTR